MEAGSVWEVCRPSVFRSLCRLLMGRKREDVVVLTLAKPCCPQSSASLSSASITSSLFTYCQSVSTPLTPFSSLDIHSLLGLFHLSPTFLPKALIPIQCKTDNDGNYDSRMSLPKKLIMVMTIVIAEPGPSQERFECRQESMA